MPYARWQPGRSPQNDGHVIHIKMLCHSLSLFFFHYMCSDLSTLMKFSANISYLQKTASVVYTLTKIFAFLAVKFTSHKSDSLCCGNKRELFY